MDELYSLSYKKVSVYRRRGSVPSIKYLNDFSHLRNDTHAFRLICNVNNIQYICKDVNEFFPFNIPSLEYTKNFVMSFLPLQTSIFIEYFGGDSYREYKGNLTISEIFRKLDSEGIEYRDFKNDW